MFRGGFLDVTGVCMLGFGSYVVHIQLVRIVLHVWFGTVRVYRFYSVVSLFAYIHLHFFSLAVHQSIQSINFFICEMFINHVHLGFHLFGCCLGLRISVVLFLCRSSRFFECICI